MPGADDFAAYVDDLTRTLDQMRERIGEWAEKGPDELHEVTVGGVTAEATLATGVTALRFDPGWLDDRDMDDVARCVVEAVTGAEAAGKEAIWTSLGDLRVGDDRLADLGRKAADGEWPSLDDDLTKRLENGDDS